MTLSEARAQLDSLPASSADTAGKHPAPSAEPQPPAKAAAQEGSDEDWGIAPKEGGISRETKMGFAFVLVLLVVFGFVVYKKIQNNRAERGDLLAAVNENQPEESSPAKPGNTPTPIAGASPQEQILQPMPEQSPEFSPVSWNQETDTTPAPAQRPMAENSAGRASASIDQFSPAAASANGSQSGQDFAPPVQNVPPDQFPQELPNHSPPVVAEPQLVPTEFNPVSPPRNEFAQAPPEPSFEPPTAPLADAPKMADSNPFATAAPPAQAEQLPSAQAAPIQLAEPPAGLGNDNEQFSAQSVSLPPRPETAQTPAGNAFSDFQANPAAENQPTATPPAGNDPFANLPADVGAESVPGNSQALGNDQGAYAPRSPEQPQPLPVQAAPAEISVANDPRFGDFEPAPAPNQYDPAPASPPTSFNPIPNELPGTSVAQVPGRQTPGAFPGGAPLANAADQPSVYVVQPRDSYWTISKKQYGSVRYFSALARYNQQRIPDPTKMRPGMKILIPSREVLESQNPDLFPKFAQAAGSVSNVAHQAGEPSGFYVDAGGRPMYRVGPNDTLGGIAQKHLGRFSRWGEIYQLNRHRLKDPNALTLGDLLILPPDASRVNVVRQAAGVR